MECKKCRSYIDDKSAYCPYCGERVENDSSYVDPFASYRGNNSHESQYTYQKQYSGSSNDNRVSSSHEDQYNYQKQYSNNESDYVDPFAAYRIDNSHEGQYNYQKRYSGKPSEYRKSGSHEDFYQYQQVYSNSKKDSNDPFQVEDNSLKNRKSLFGMLLSIISIIICFYSQSFGIVLFAVGLILILSGFKQSTILTKIGSVLIGLLSTVGIVITNLFIWLGSMSITLSNGMEYTMKDFIISGIYAHYNLEEVYGFWESRDGEVLDISSEYFYRLSAEDTGKYMSGYYQLDPGYELSEGDEFFADSEFYYYEFIEESDQFVGENRVVLCLDKDDFSRLVVYFPEQEKFIEMERQ